MGSRGPLTPWIAQMLQIKPHPSQVLTICPRELQRLWEKLITRGEGSNRAFLRRKKAQQKFIPAMRSRVGRAPGPLGPPLHLSGRQKREAFALSKASHPVENQFQISQLQNSAPSTEPSGLHKSNNMQINSGADAGQGKVGWGSLQP